MKSFFDIRGISITADRATKPINKSGQPHITGCPDLSQMQKSSEKFPFYRPHFQITTSSNFQIILYFTHKFYIVTASNN